MATPATKQRVPELLCEQRGEIPHQLSIPSFAKMPEVFSAARQGERFQRKLSPFRQLPFVSHVRQTGVKSNIAFQCGRLLLSLNQVHYRVDYRRHFKVSFVTPVQEGSMNFKNTSFSTDVTISGLVTPIICLRDVTRITDCKSGKGRGTRSLHSPNYFLPMPMPMSFAGGGAVLNLQHSGPTPAK